MSASPISPDDPPRESRALAVLRKALMWGLPTFLIVLIPSCIVSFSPTLKRQVYGPDYLASVTLEPEKATLSLELTANNPFGLAEFDRRLSIAAEGGSAATDLTQDHGGFSSANLYRTRDGKLVIADTYDAEIVSFAPVRIDHYGESYLGNRYKGAGRRTDLRDNPLRRTNRQHFGGLTESNYFDGLFYVGAFRFREASGADGKRSRVWAFVPASEQEEVIRDPGG